MSGSADRANFSLPSQAQHGRVSVRVTPDGLEAHLTVTPPREEGQPVTATQAMTALAKAGVTFGIDSDAIEQLIGQLTGLPAYEASARTAVVARAKAPVRGQDAVITYHELLQTPGGYPLIREDGSVDYFELNLVRNVARGTVLATRQPATKGVPGMNVLGAPVPCADGKDQILRAGKGCRLSEDGLSIVAETEGHAVLGQDGRVNVSPIFEIRGDVDTSTGNIDFVGTVIVMGSVNAGFTVRAGQSVQVHGGIDGGTVEAGGDVTVRYGIQGAGRGRVQAGGKIQCRFMENADVRCQRDLIVSDGILHSKVRAGGKVTVTGRRGSIIGGQVKARGEVSARVLGSHLTTTTEIEVGVSPEIRDELEVVRRSLHEAEEGFRKSVQAVGLLREAEARSPADFSAARREMLMKAMRSQYHFQAQRDQLVVRKAALEEELLATSLGRVRAFDVAYPGVRVLIGNESYIVIDSLQHVCFYLSEQHEVTIGPA